MFHARCDFSLSKGSEYERINRGFTLDIVVRLFNMIEFYQLFTWSNFFALLTLTILEIILGIDNIVFLSILVNKLPMMPSQSN